MILEFLLSAIVLIGGGILILKGIAVEFVSGIMTLVVGFWFQRRQNESTVNTLMKKINPETPPQIPPTTPNENPSGNNI